MLHRDISSGLHDLDYSEVVLMPGDKVGDDLEEQISTEGYDREQHW